LLAAGTQVSSTAAAATASSIGAVALILGAIAASVLYKRHLAAAASKVVPQLGGDTASVLDKAVASKPSLFESADGADAAGLCVPANGHQVS
jgi:hypothetical protein